MSPLEIVIFLPIVAALAIWLGAPARITSITAALINLLIVGGIALGFDASKLGAGEFANVSSRVVLENPEKTKHPGVRILFRRSEMHEPQTLYFFSSDLSSWNIKQNPGFKRFCESLGPCNGFTKSASYLMHLDSFESVRDLLLARCETMLQDDTGIMWKDFPREVWSPVAYGWYPGPIERFKDKYQTDLATWYRENKAAPIPFGIGCNWRPGMSTLIFAKARREPLKALPVE